MVEEAQERHELIGYLQCNDETQKGHQEKPSADQKNMDISSQKCVFLNQYFYLFIFPLFYVYVYVVS